ncbi:MAG: S8 family serine peptidase [Halioglobus sp.]
MTPIFLGVLALSLPYSTHVSAQLTVGGDGIDVRIEDRAEQRLEEDVEEEVEEEVEDTVADTVAEQVEESVEQEVEERVLSLGGDGIDIRIEERAELRLEEEIEEEVEEDVIEIVEETIEEGVESVVEEEIAETIEESLEETIENSVEEVVEESVEEIVENSVEETVEDAVEVAVEQSVEQVVEISVEDSVEDVVEASVEDSVEQVVEISVEDTVEDVVEASVEQAVELEVETSVQLAVAGAVEQNIEQSVERDVEGEVASAVEEQVESEIEEILEGLESRLEVDESRIRKDQWLVMAEPEVFDQLADEGYLFTTVTDLPGMGMRLAEVAAPSSFEISVVRQGVIDVVGKERAEVDLNHIYTAGNPVDESFEGSITPRNAIGFPADTDGLALRIGMIDSGVDTNHPALKKSSIESKTFVSNGAKLPDYHGTAIASIIVASDTDYQGLAPSAELYAAAVFEDDRERGEIASTVSLVRALDWLMSSGVDVVNISLAGPPNRLLEAALNRASEQGLMIIAAAGNGGPVAKPMYPAAYDAVVAVTAVDAGGQVYRLANRGAYLDLAAPGVSVLHAKAGGGYSASSGTSFAVPFASTAAARLRRLDPGADVLQLLQQSAQDLGAPGKDEIYGYGLLRPDLNVAAQVATATSGR